VVKKRVFKSRVNESLQTKPRDLDRSSFHAFEPATLKDLSVKRRHVLGTVKSP